MERDSARSSFSSSSARLLPDPKHDLASRIHANNASHPSLSGKYALPVSPRLWNTIVDVGTPEPDDHLHNPDPRRDRKWDRGGHIFTARGFANLGCLTILALGILMLFAGYPILVTVLVKKPTAQGGFNLGGINASGQIPDFAGNYGLIDKETPESAYTKQSHVTGEQMVLVFSDEFNTEGRSFFQGDDPFWEAVDLHYWGTNDLEWYDATQPTTKNGALHLTLEAVNPADNHGMSYRSGMIQSWNKFCFTGGILEAAVMLPGSNTVAGLWPAVWALGNLGRAGYGASLDGLWPYSYDECDVGTLPNQTWPGTLTPPAAVTSGGDPAYNNVLSYLPGQRLSACTCPGESHPGPMRSNGSFVGRAAPEIDVLEATVDDRVGKVSLSAQWAPFDASYNWKNTSDTFSIQDPNTQINTYKGGVYQMTTSGLALTNPDCYEQTKGCFAVFAFDYKPGYDDGYIAWINDDKPAWMVRGTALGPNTDTQISHRPIPYEPMYIIANHGFSNNFAAINLDELTFPRTMAIDYIRVYQPKSAINIGCDPIDYPTAEYIETYKHVYTNPNLTTWEQADQPWPRNRLANGPNGKC